jgi:hypothetical protein
MTRTRRLIALTAAAALTGLSAACSGGGEAASTTTDTTPVTEPVETAAPTTETPTTPATTPPTTAAPTTTEATTTTTAAPTTTTIPAVPRLPLTGQPLGDGVTDPDRAAMVVKIDNVGRARPQTGLNQADIVFEEIVEGRATRFAAVFHSQGSNPVGPIRSGRTQDVDLLSGLNQPLFVWSGGNRGVVAAIEDSDFISLNATGRPPATGFFRTDRPKPHNLYNNTDPLWQQVTLALGRPTALFDYVEPGASAAGELRSWVQVQMGGNQVRWEWDPGSGTYLRSQGGRAHELTDGRASADNVVVMVTGYRPSSVDARSPEAITVGSGFAFVFSGGHYQVGTWARANNTAPITLTAPDGAPIELEPGRTWVELADALDHDTQSG